MNLTKIAYHDPRPYMTDNLINPYGCTNEYGNPSGHALLCSSFFSLLFLDNFHIKSNKCSKLTYFLWFGLLISTIVTVSFSRLYLGMHTLNQVLYGALLGIWLAVYFHYCLRNFIISHTTNLMEGTDNVSNPRVFKQNFIVATFIMTMAILSQIVAFEFVSSVFEIP